MRPPTSPNQNSEKLARRLHAMFGMHDAGIEMLRCRLRREHPEETPEQIAKRIAFILRAERYDPAVFEKRSCSIFSAAS